MTRFDNGRSEGPGDSSNPFDGVPDIDERLADWVDGTMSGRDRERFEAEMRVSPPLRKQVEEYEQTVSSIQAALRADTHDTDLVDRVLAGLAQEATGAARPTRSMMPYIWATTCAAALLGVAVMIDSWGGTSTRPSDDHRVSAELGLSAGLESVNDPARVGPSQVGEQRREDEENAVKANAQSPKSGELAALNKPRTGLMSGVGSKDKDKAGSAEGSVSETKAMKRKQPVVGAPPSEADTGSLNPARSSSGSPVGGKPTIVERRAVDRVEAGKPDDNRAIPAPDNLESPAIKSPSRRAGPGSAIGPKTGRPGTPPGPAVASPAGGGPTGSAGGRGGRALGTPAPSASPVRSSKNKSTKTKPEASVRELSTDAKEFGKSADRTVGELQKQLVRYSVRFARDGAGAEVLPLITIEGLTVAFGTASDRVRENAERQGDPSQSTDDFYLGAARGFQLAQMKRFFKSQMRARDEWLEQREVAGEQKPATEMAEQLNVEDYQSLGGLRLFAVGPVVERDRSPEKPGSPEKPESTEKPEALGGGAKPMQVPGEKEAKGHDYVERDWLVVGPQSEVRKLLAELRRYAEVGKSEWRSGEARVAMQDRPLRRGRAGLGKGTAKPKPAVQPTRPEKPGSGVAAGGADVKKEPTQAERGRAAALPGAEPEPVQRVVIRFRVRR